MIRLGLCLVSFAAGIGVHSHEHRYIRFLWRVCLVNHLRVRKYIWKKNISHVNIQIVKISGRSTSPNAKAGSPEFMIRSALSRPLLSPLIIVLLSASFLTGFSLNHTGIYQKLIILDSIVLSSASESYLPSVIPRKFIISPQRYQLICPHKIHRFTVTTCFSYGIDRE